MSVMDEFSHDSSSAIVRDSPLLNNFGIGDKTFFLIVFQSLIKEVCN